MVVFYLYLGKLKVALLLKSTELLDIFQLYELLLYFYGSVPSFQWEGRKKDHHAIILLMTIYSFANKYLLSIYCLPDIVLGTGNEAVSKSGKIFLPSYKACILVGEDQQ